MSTALINFFLSFLIAFRTRNRANGVTKWFTTYSNARSSATRPRDAADRRRERNVTTRHPVNAAPTIAGWRPRCSASHSWTLCEYKSELDTDHYMAIVLKRENRGINHFEERAPFHTGICMSAHKKRNLCLHLQKPRWYNFLTATTHIVCIQRRVYNIVTFFTTSDNKHSARTAPFCIHTFAVEPNY